MLTADDFGISEHPTLGDEEEKTRIKEEVEGMIGMGAAKHLFEEIEVSALIPY